MTKLVLIVVVFVCVGFVFGREFQIQNRCKQTIWVGIQGNDGKPPLAGGGFVLGSNKKVKLQSAENWAGRFWARTGCDSRTKHCQTGDCGNSLKCQGRGGVPPVTLLEITLSGHGNLDYYDVSLVDGFNVPAVIQPINGRGTGRKYSCEPTTCLRNVNKACPKELRLVKNGYIVGCKSACEAFKTDLYCCRGRHDKPSTCRERDFPVAYPSFFKRQCPDAYSYAYDDHKSTYTCQARGYLVTFC